MFGQGITGQSGFKGFGVPSTSSSAASTGTSTFSFGTKPAQSQQQQSLGLGQSLTTAATTAPASLQFPAFGTATSLAATKPAVDGFKLGPTMTCSAGSSVAFGLTSTAVANATQAQGQTQSQIKSTTAPSLSFGQQSATIQKTEATPAAGITFGGTSLLSQPKSDAQPAVLTTSGSSLAADKSIAASQSSAQASNASLKNIASDASSTSKSLNYKELEDIINKWIHELEEQEKVFLNQAKQVNSWDRMLIRNGENITQLNNEIERLKLEQSSLNRELDFILSRQQELEETLVPLEEQVKDQQTVPYMQHADIERERTYQMAEGIDNQLKRMMQDLKDIINHINSSNANLKESEDPMVQVAKILNSHMDSLQWVDQNSLLLQKRVEDVSKYVENQKREHERSLRLNWRSSISDSRFEKFVKVCLRLQKEKKYLELQIRMELENWRGNAKRGAPSAECRQRISEYLKLFKQAQETQDSFIEKEKLRLLCQGNGMSKEIQRKLKARLRFFSILNRQHEVLLEMASTTRRDIKYVIEKWTK
eukprot:gene15976-17585_t